MLRETSTSAFAQDEHERMNWNDCKTRWQCAEPGRCLGLTLIELVVVLVVLVALAGLLVPLLSGLGEQAQEDATRATLSQVAQAILGTGGYEQAMRYARDSDGDKVGYGTGLPWPSNDEVDAGRPDHPQLRYLFVAPEALPDYDLVTQIGWRGAWLDISASGGYSVDTPADPRGFPRGFTTTYGDGDGDDVDNDGTNEADDPTPLDGWGNPIVIQWPDPDGNGPDPDGDGVADPDELRNVRLVSAGADGFLDTPVDELTPLDKNDDRVLYLYREDPNP
ncbi:MAG: hypothetical protein MI741_03785 [Rhodospirillales bacterium]|nr:hypothetical protein [Rhodospirillales bacterium]